jgi:hypothetical protein
VRQLYDIAHSALVASTLFRLKDTRMAETKMPASIPADTAARIARQAQKVAPPRAAPTPPSSPAESVFRRLVLYIREFEAQLDLDKEVGGRMVSFGSVVQFHIVDMGYWGPDIITFDGIDEHGNRMKLIQNISQLNVLLVEMPKRESDAEPRRIGFELGTRRDDADTKLAPVADGEQKNSSPKEGLAAGSKPAGGG